MATERVESRFLGALPLLLHVCRAIGLAETIDHMVQWDQTRCRLSPGGRIEDRTGGARGSPARGGPPLLR